MTKKSTNTNVSEIINLNWQYRIYPTDQIVKDFERTLDTCRFAYNLCVDLAKTIYIESKITISSKELMWYLADEGIGKTIYSKVLQDVPRRYEKSRNCFLDGRVGPPKFKKLRDYNSFKYVQSGFKVVDNPRASNPKNKLLRLSKINETEKFTFVKLNYHRPFPKNCVIKNVTVLRKRSGDWYVNFEIEVPAEGFHEQSKNAGNKKAVGIDLGLKSFAALSTGETIETPHFLKKQLKKLQRRQRQLSRKVSSKKGEKKSANYEKQRKRVAKIHEKIANQRTDFDYQLAHKLVNENDTIACENLSSKFMLKNRKLSKAAADAGFSKFKTILGYEAFKHQTKVIFVDPKYTTQDCSVCRNRIKKDLSVRIHECHCCGVKIDRDVNAAINVLLKAAPEFSADTVYLVTDKLRWDSAKDTLSENVNTKPPDSVATLGVCVVEERSHSL